MKAPKKPMINGKKLGAPFRAGFGLLEPILGAPIAFVEVFTKKKSWVKK
jgi:hypothetical protein